MHSMNVRTSAFTAMRAVHTAYLILGVTVLLLIVAEGLAGVWLRRTRTNRAEQFLPIIAEAGGGGEWQRPLQQEWRQVETVYDDFVGYRLSAFEGKLVHLDSLGYRRTLHLPQPGAPVKIILFGGSTMIGRSTRDDHTIPSELARLLAESGFNVDVRNHGSLGHFSTQELGTLVADLQRGDSSDIVIFLDGLNERGAQPHV